MAATFGPGDQPEYLDSGGGPLLPRRRRSPRRRRTALIAVGGLLGAGGLAALGYAAVGFLATGPQPAQALPATTVAYASVDLDPSGEQKLEALRTLNRFPAFRDLGVHATDDIRRRLVEELHCDGASYDADFAPWLGDRMAVALLPGSGGPDGSGPAVDTVVVLELTDAAAFERAFGPLATTCGGGTELHYALDGDWALLSESQAVADAAALSAGHHSLADDATYRRWTAAAGSPGIATFYLAPVAGEMLADSMGRLSDEGGASSGVPSAGLAQPGIAPALATRPGGSGAGPGDFGGAAATLRFADGAVELEAAGDAGGGTSALTGATSGGDLVATLPADTALAVGVGFREGWFGQLLDQLSSYAGGGSAPDRLRDELSRETGLDLPADVETLLGRSAAFAVGRDARLGDVFEQGDTSGLEVGVKVRGDADGILRVLDKLRATVPADSEGLLTGRREGDVVVVSPSEDYRAALARRGDLGSREKFRDVVREADRAGMVVYVDLDRVGGWFPDAADHPEEILTIDAQTRANLEPLSAFGLSAWSDGGVAHGVLRVTTD
jgi:hypothetical protein